MGRPLNKKFFGNRNIGTNRPTDDGIGGEGVASVSTATQGSININNSYKTFPALTGTAPTIANGTTATYAVTWEVDTVSLSGGTGYTAGTISSITGLDAFANTPTRFTVTQSGGTPSFNAFTNRGEYTSINGNSITTWAVVKGAANDTQATITFRVKSIAVVNQGSGYVTVPSLSWGTLNGTTPSGQTPTLTTDSGAVGSSTNMENAILAWAYIGGNLVEVDIQRQVSTKRYKVNKTGDTGTNERLGTRIARIKYTGVADGTAGYTAAQGVEMNIIATDAAGGTYLVRKLWNRTCTVYPVDVAFGGVSGSAGSVFTSGKQYKWTFGTADASTVKIQNA